MMELPRKLDAGDDAARPFLSKGTIAVFVDGIEQKFVQSYDMDAGEITRYMKNEKGEIFTVDGNVIATETIKGVVTVRYDPR